MSLRASQPLATFFRAGLLFMMMLCGVVVHSGISVADEIVSLDNVMQRVQATVKRWQTSTAMVATVDDGGDPDGALTRSCSVDVQRPGESFAFQLRGMRDGGFATPKTSLQHHDTTASTRYQSDGPLRRESPPITQPKQFQPHVQALQCLGFDGTLQEFLDPRHERVDNAQLTCRRLTGGTESDAGTIEVVRTEALPGVEISRRIRLVIQEEFNTLAIVDGTTETLVDSEIRTTHRVRGKLLHADEKSLRYECLCAVLGPPSEAQRQSAVKVQMQWIANSEAKYQRSLESFPGNPNVTEVRDGVIMRQGSLRSKIEFAEPASPFDTWLIVNDIVLATIVLWMLVRTFVFPRRQPRVTMLICLVVGGGTLSGCRDPSADELGIVLRESLPAVVLRNSTFVVSFDVRGFSGDPYDPAEIDAQLEMTNESGEVFIQPAFYTVPHQVLLDHDREVVRRSGEGHWFARWTPAECGVQRWKLMVRTRNGNANTTGEFVVEPSELAGRVQVSAQDSRHFALTDGRRFYPFGHGTRSPLESRWAAFSEIDPEQVATIQRHRTFNYDAWFQKMNAQGANFCVVWMAPWWLGLQWSESAPGYGGVGHYNQIHAAQLDRIIELAERYDIKVLLYTANHGQFSSVIDREWQSNPYNVAIEGGIAEHPIDFFRSPECRESYKKYLRYLIARYGHSNSLFGFGLCTETNWVEPYHGRRCPIPTSDFYGTAEPNYQIQSQPQVVDEWLVEMAEFIKSIDAHQHLVTTQFARIGLGDEVWEHDCFDFVTSNCYQGDVWSSQVQQTLRSRSLGTAEGLFGWAEYHRATTNKPVLVGEWGGEFLGNSAKRLAAEFHVGNWALSMTAAAGVTGFWWWNEVDRANLYNVYGALRRFWRDETTVRAELQSIQWQITTANPWHRELFAGGQSRLPSATHGGIGLVGEDCCYGYVYHLLASVGDFEVDPEGDERIIPCDDLAIVVPDILQSGQYRLELWDCHRGMITENRTVVISVDENGRYLKLPPIGVDIAFKLIALEPT